MVSATPRALYLSERDPVPILQKGGWTPWSVWMATQNLDPTELDLWTFLPVSIRHTDLLKLHCCNKPYLYPKLNDYG
jgi:hypothetical protein